MPLLPPASRLSQLCPSSLAGGPDLRTSAYRAKKPRKEWIGPGQYQIRAARESGLTRNGNGYGWSQEVEWPAEEDGEDEALEYGAEQLQCVPTGMPLVD